ncbi:hypothetical protein scyTo_0023665, partial [Scyliorhinus torazame]|nr:hypothetical protein [Scyliorhinus torazame]
IAPIGERDNVKTHRQNLDHLLDLTEEGDLTEYEQIISSYVSIAQETPADKGDNPHKIIATILDQLDPESLKAILQHLLIFREHSVRKQ